MIVEFSALELMMFFGALHRMPLGTIKERMKILVKLLEISSIHQRIETMRYYNVVGVDLYVFHYALSCARGGHKKQTVTDKSLLILLC